MSGEDWFKVELIGAIPELTRHARFLLKRSQDVSDLVHDTVETALRNADDYTRGTNMKAWLFRIQRGLVGNMRRREITRRNYAESNPAEEATLPGQLDFIAFHDAKAIIERLPMDQQEALFLINYEGRSYAEAAELMGCSVGTVKSRVSRARAEIASSLEIRHGISMDRQGPDQGM